MTRIEEWLLERMTVRRWLVAGAVGLLAVGGAGFWIGWDSGERHVANEITATVQNAADQLKDSMAKTFPPETPEQISQDKADAERAKKEAADMVQHEKDIEQMQQGK